MALPVQRVGQLAPVPNYMLLPLLVVAVIKAVLGCLFRGITSLATLVLLLGSTPAVSAQKVLASPSTYQPTGLQTIIKVPPHSALVRVRYESNSPGPVQLELRHDQRRVVYSERKRETQFVGNYDLAHLPAGDYTLHLSAAGFHHVEALRLQRATNSLVTVELIRLDSFYISSRSLFPSAGPK